MMTSISGELGAGKTYVLARELHEQHEAGVCCIANFDHSDADIIIKNDPAKLLELIRQIAVIKQLGGEMCDVLPTFRHTGIFIGLDEAHLVFGRETARADMEEVILPFISLARKADVHIWYVVQDPATIHKTFRRYTRTYIRVRPMINVFRTKFVPHETRPVWRRERRLIVPLVYEEYHRLDPEDPVFSYRRVSEAKGGQAFHKESTIEGFRIKTNSSKFIHSLYNSNEMAGVNVDPSKEEDFALLKGVCYVPRGMNYPDKIPTFRKWARAIGMKVRGPKTPPRIYINDWEMPKLEPVVGGKKMLQEEKIMDFMDLLKNPEYGLSKTFPRSLRKLYESKLSPKSL